MSFSLPQFRPPPLPEPVPVVSVVTRSDPPRTDRPIFRAPPIELRPDFFHPASMAEELRRISLGER